MQQSSPGKAGRCRETERAQCDAEGADNEASESTTNDQARPEKEKTKGKRLTTSMYSTYSTSCRFTASALHSSSSQQHQHATHRQGP